LTVWQCGQVIVSHDVTIATNLTDGSGLTLDCDPDDNGCIRNIKDRLSLILVNLQGVADCGDLINFQGHTRGNAAAPGGLDRRRLPLLVPGRSADHGGDDPGPR
jgi:hypothetical protein